MNVAQKIRLWALGVLGFLQFVMLLAIDSSAHNAAVPVGGVAGVANTGSVSSVYDEIGFSIVVFIAAAIVAGFTLYRFLRPLPARPDYRQQRPTNRFAAGEYTDEQFAPQPGPRDWSPQDSPRYPVKDNPQA